MKEEELKEFKQEFIKLEESFNDSVRLMVKYKKENAELKARLENCIEPNGDNFRSIKNSLHMLRYCVESESERYSIIGYIEDIEAKLKELGE